MVDDILNLNHKGKIIIRMSVNPEEIIFMTYSFVHTKINEEAFPKAINLYNKEIMTGRGKGKYMYKNSIRQEGEQYLREQMNKYFPSNKIMYIV